MEEKRAGENAPWKNRARPAIYAMGGVYLVYLAYSMFKKISVTSANEQMLMIIFTIIFAVIGLAMILFGLVEGYKYSKELHNTNSQKPEEPGEDKK